jgi:ABC-2 type transport system ATP-binding protein
VITATALIKRFGRTIALDGLSLEIAKGEMFALIGPDGAGKTTFFRLAAGLIAPTSGTLLNTGRASLGFVPQRFSLYPDLTVDENLALRARFYGVPASIAVPRAKRLLESVGLERFGARLAGALSGGMKQKLALASALLIEPSILLLDEPTTGVDPMSRREFWATLHRLHHEGLTIVVSTPYMDEAAYATRLGFLHEGRLLATGTRSEVLASYPRALLEVRTIDRVAVRARLAGVSEVDDVSLFGTVLHVRSAAGAVTDFRATVARALDGMVSPDAVVTIAPSLEDVFVLNGDIAVARTEGTRTEGTTSVVPTFSDRQTQERVA